MRAVIYTAYGGPEVFRLVERPVPEPAAGEVRVAIAVSGVNPTDWKSRKGTSASGPLPFPEVVPNQDGAGTIDAVGEGVDPSRVGERVWLWESAHGRPGGTAQEFVTIPSAHAVPLGPGTTFEQGASLGVPALTAHRCLTLGQHGPSSLSPGALRGARVLVAGGAGAVGHAAIQLAGWAGALVIATVSSEEKARLAKAAGAAHTVHYGEPKAAGEIRGYAPDGIDLVVEVAPAANGALDRDVLAPGGTVAAYASEPVEIALAARPLMTLNAAYRFVLLYTMPEDAKRQAVEDVSVALEAGALPVGEDAGLPLRRFGLEQTPQAHAAVESGVVGKVLIEVGAEPRVPPR